MKKILLTAACFLCSTGLSMPIAQAADIQFDGYPDLNSNLDAVIPLYKQLNPDVNITYVMNNHGDHHKKLTTNLATGSGAGNVSAIDVGFLGSFINGGGLENLSAAPYNADALEAGFVPYAWAQGKGADGNQYGIPIDVGPGVTYYRRDLLDSVGVKPEEAIASWESYIALGRKLKERNVYLIGDAADVAHTIIRTTVKPGEGYFFDQDGNSLIQSERFIKAFTLAKQIRDEGLDGQIAAWTNEWNSAFQNGTFATQLSGCWLIGHLQNWLAPTTKGLWGVAHLPDGIYGSWGGTFLSIPKQANDKSAAWDFIKWYTTAPEAQLSGLRVIGAFPAQPGLYSDPMFSEQIEFLGGQQARLLFADIAQKITPVAPMKGDLIAEDVVINAALREVLNEGKDVMVALEEAERLVKRRVR